MSIKILVLDPNVAHPWWDLWVVGENHYVNWNRMQGNGCGYLHHIHSLGRMYSRFRFFSIFGSVGKGDDKL